MRHERHGSPKHYIDKVVQNCIGFRYSSSGSAWWLPWAVLRRLLFTLSPIWPHSAAHLLASCHLKQADFVLVKLIDGRKRLCHIHCLSLASVPCPLQNTLEKGGRAYEGQEQLRVFQLFQRKYVYSPSQDTFKPVDAMPAHLPRQICSAFADLHFIHTAGQSWASFNSAQVLTRRNMLAMYGANRNLFRRNFLSSIVRHIYLEIYVVQFLEIGYLFYRHYYWLPGLLAALTTAAGMHMLLRVRQQNIKMTSLVNQRRLTPIVKGGWVRAVSSHRLVPGDVIVLQKGKAMCDMVILQGSCLVVESMLSGEAAQVRKSAFVPDGDAYNPDKHQSSTLYAGTNVQQVWNAVDPEDEVLAMVCRTGLNTQVGGMVRELANPSKLVHQKDPFIRDTFMLYAFAFGLQLCLVVFRLSRVTRYQTDVKDIVLWVMDMCCHSAPPSIPTIFLVLTHIARMRLDRAGLSLLFSKALRVGANINMVCFDKTGTLTDSVAALHGVLPVHKGQFDSLQQNAMRWDNRLRQAMAVCNGLALSNKTVVGMDLERHMFKAVEARFLERDVIVLPRRPDHVSKARTAKLTVQKTLEFSSQTLRSGVVVVADDSPAGTAFLFVRGAPGPIKDMVQPSSVPDNFDQVRDDFSSNSFRMMAMAVGTIHHAHQLDLMHMTQQQVEAQVTHMDLLCLMVLTNSVRPDSEDTINQLQHGGGIRTMMITGDYHHTAIAVARDVGMLSSSAQMVIIDIPRQSHNRQNPHGANPQGIDGQRPVGHGANPQGVDGQGQSGHGGQGQAGLDPEEEEEENKHSLESQLSLAQSVVGHHPSWGLNSKREENLQEEKLGSGSALADGASQESRAGQSPLASSQVAPSAQSPAGATVEAAPHVRRLSHRASALKTRQSFPTGRNNKRVVLPPLTTCPSSHSPTPAGRDDYPLTLLTPTTRDCQHTSASFAKDEALSCPGLYAALSPVQSEQGVRVPAGPSPDQPMQDATMPFRDRQPSGQRFARHSSQCLSPFLGLFTPSFGHTPGGDPNQTHQAAPKPGLAGLRFIQVPGNQDCEGSWALSALAEGQFQCTVTGDALEHMLQLEDTSLLEAVMRNAVVFARMKPHQKGQVMDMLGTAGLHQLLDGQHRHIQGLGNTTLFCGDGINDLAALSAADVGMAVGATDAIVAASLSTRRGSVAGVCSYIKASKASHSLTASLFKYTILYQWVMAVAAAAAYFVDGSTLADAQIVVIDVQAITLAFTVCFLPALKQMNWYKPGLISTAPTLMLLGSMALLAVLVHVINMTVLHKQSWFTGGTGHPDQNPVPTLAWLVANFELLGPLISLMVDTRRFCEPALRFKPILLLLLVSLSLSYTAALGRPGLWGNLFMQYEFPLRFKVLFAWSVALEATSYGIICHTLRLALQRFQQNRVTPA